MLPIVIVDDLQEDLMLAARVFRQCKVLNPLHLLKGGEECLAYFQGTGKYRKRTLPCLVLLDMVMAPVSGLDVLSSLQDDPLARDSMMIMISGLTDIKLIQQGYQLGARTFLVKPINVEDLMLMFGGLRGVSIEKVSAGFVISLQTRERFIPSEAPAPGDDTAISA